MGIKYHFTYAYTITLRISMDSSRWQKRRSDKFINLFILIKIHPLDSN